MNPYPGRADALPGARSGERGLASDAVVYVDHVPAAAESALAADSKARPRLAQKDQSFVPRVLAIAVGTRVDFPNLDPIYHNVFSLSPARRFDLGKYPRGSSRQVLFSKPGRVNVYCDIHSNMEAFVYVLPHHGFAQPSADGAFALPDLPAGRYVLHSWHPALGERGLPIEIPETGDLTVTLGY
jgi:plastocyanin